MLCASNTGEPMRRPGWSGVVVRAGVLLVMMMMMLSLPTAHRAHAQVPVRVWVRPLAALPVGDFGNRGGGVGANSSVGYDVGGAVSLGALSIYGEYQEISFGCEECAEVELEGSVLDRGWGAGVLVALGSPIARFEPWGRLGVISHHLRFRHAEESAYSGASLGWDAAVGAETRPVRWLRIEPLLLVRSYDAGFAFSIDVPDREVSVTYVALGLGIGFGL